jgi:hypothetical protein
VIDAQPLTEKACILLEMHPMRTSMLVAICFVHVLNVGMRRITDEGMTNEHPIFAYLGFGPGKVSLRGLLRPIKVAV